MIGVWGSFSVNGSIFNALSPLLANPCRLCSAVLQSLLRESHGWGEFWEFPIAQPSQAAPDPAPELPSAAQAGLGSPRKLGKCRDESLITQLFQDLSWNKLFDTKSRISARVQAHCFQKQITRFSILLHSRFFQGSSTSWK